MRISAIDGSPAHWLERGSDLLPVRIPRLLILTEGVATPHLNRLIQQIQRGITRRPTYMLHKLNRPATPVKASVIAQPEQKPCRRLTIITACHEPELTSSVEHRY